MRQLRGYRLPETGPCHVFSTQEVVVESLQQWIVDRNTTNTFAGDEVRVRGLIEDCIQQRRATTIAKKDQRGAAWDLRDGAVDMGL